MTEWAIGVDMGGTKLAVAAVDRKGKILHERLHPTHQEILPASVEAHIIDVTQQFQKLMGNAPKGIGIGIAAQIDSANGIVHSAPNLKKWCDIPLQADLQKMTGLPVKITNDVRAATYGEWLFGAGKNCDNLVCLFVGTGIGGGIVSEGNLIQGHSYTAGEIGHIIVDINGPICTCGNRGCLEAMAGGWAIAKQTQEAIQRDANLGKKILEYAKGDLKAVEALHVGQAFLAGDPLAIQMIGKVKEALIAGVISIVHVLNPQRIILGGGVISGLPGLVKQIAEGVRKRAIPAATHKLEIVPAALGGHAGVIGAATSVLH